MATGTIKGNPMLVQFVQSTNYSGKGDSTHQAVFTNFSLPAGQWILFGHARFNGGTTSKRRGFQVSTDSTPFATDFGNTTIYAATGDNITATVVYPITVQSDTTIYVSGFIDSSTNVTVDYEVYGLKVG